MCKDTKANKSLFNIMDSNIEDSQFAENILSEIEEGGTEIE